MSLSVSLWGTFLFKMSQRTFFKRRFQYKIKRVSQKNTKKAEFLVRVLPFLKLSFSLWIQMVPLAMTNIYGMHFGHIPIALWSLAYSCGLLCHPSAFLQVIFVVVLRQSLIMWVWNILCSPGLVVLWVWSLIQVVTAIFLLIPCKNI